MPGPGIPEIQWTRLHDKDGLIHFFPVIEKVPMEGHHLVTLCNCRPEIIPTRDSLIVVHHVIH
jgi:hypothetical protein